MHPYSFFTSTNLTISFHKIPSKFWFERILKIIKKFYRVISVQHVENYFYNNEKFNNCCNICFDDGHRTVFENALPVLKKMNLPASIFISPEIIAGSKNYWFQDLNHIEKKIGSYEIKKVVSEILDIDYEKIKNYCTLNILKSQRIEIIHNIINVAKNKFNIDISEIDNLTINQLKELLKCELISIGAHSLSHPILKNESNEKTKTEIINGIEKLKALAGIEIKYFAYPNGKYNLDFNRREEIYLKQANIKLAFSTDSGWFKKSTNPFRIPRIGFVGSTRENNFWIFCKLLLVPYWKFIEAKKEVNERRKIKNILCRKI